MIHRLFINNFRSINTEDLEIKPLTVFTGLNSTGKSSCFSAILDLLYEYNDPIAFSLLSDYNFSFNANRNRNVGAKKYAVKLTDNNKTAEMIVTEDGVDCTGELQLSLENNLFYLSASRLGYSYPAESVSDKIKVGVQGEYLYGTFDKLKSQKLDDKLIKNDNSYTLSTQVSYWLSYILSNKFEMQTEKKTNENNVKVSYIADGIDNLSPRQLGVGVSYLVKILIMCLSAKSDDVLMIENPEIHLHPGAQSRLGEFFAFIANAGIQVLLETHSEHMLDSIQYQIFKKKLSFDAAILYYKGKIEEDFLRLNYSSDGHYDKEFPKGFFDATLSELLEIE